MHAGSLPYRNGLGGYREVHVFGGGSASYFVADRTQKINHAGYSRHILQRNPLRINEYGDELDDSESDPDADADAEEENPYADVRLEGKISQPI